MMESNTYKDPSKEKVITKGDLNKMVWRSLLLQASFNYERMQACGWLYGLLPGLKKIHKNKEDLSNSMKDNMEFFNTHPFLVNFIMGLILAMEENKEDRNTIRAVKVATMGPLGGIGDALFWLTALPICVGIGGDSAVKVQEGVLDAVMPNMLALGYTLLMYKLLKKGYSPVKLITITVVMGILAKAIQQFTGFAIL